MTIARGDVRGAIHQLDTQGRVQEIANRDARLEAIAREYVRQPDRTLVVSPDNQSRMELNQVIHRALQRAGHVHHREHHVRVLIARQEVTGADRQWAEQYRPGDVVRYTKGSQTLGLEAGEYVRVANVDGEQNLVTVRAARIAVCVALRSTRYSATKRRCFGVKAIEILVNRSRPHSMTS